jgi:putative chitinase
MITLDQLRAIMPFSGKRAEIFIAPLNSGMEEFGIDTPVRAGMFLANLCHESGNLRYVLEIASGDAYNGRKNLGNTRPRAFQIAAEHGMLPGPMWRGRGLIQITGFDNYAAASQGLYDDPDLLLHHPELLEQPADAARSACWFWWRAKLNPVADSGDFDAVCDIINRGRKTPSIGDSIGYDDRLKAWNRAKKVL